MDLNEAKELVSKETGWHCFDAFSTGAITYVVASPDENGEFTRAFYPVENGVVNEPLSVGDLLYAATSDEDLAAWLIKER